MEQRELLVIAESPIFKGVDINELNKILSYNHPLIKKYNRGEIVWYQDTILDKLIIVIDGKLKAQMTSIDGKVINMEEFGKNQPVAIPILFSKNQQLPVNLYSLSDSEIFCLPKELLIKCCMANQKILENILEIMSNKVNFLSGKIKFLQLNTIKQKIASVLIEEFSHNKGKSFKLSTTKEELAKEMGVTRPSLSREFKKLVEDKIISQDRDVITVLNLEMLKNYK